MQNRENRRKYVIKCIQMGGLIIVIIFTDMLFRFIVSK